jgi:hypothetical protein
MAAMKFIINPTGPTVALKPGHSLKSIYEAIFGRTDRIPVKLDAPYQFWVDETRAVEAYLLDLSRVTAAEYSRLISYYWHRFSISPEEARQIIASYGVPLRADGVELETSHAT